MRILLLHQHFNNPGKGGPLRSYYLATALVNAGHEVIVVTAHNEKKYVQMYYERFHVHYLPVSYHNRYNFYQRGFSFFRFVRQAVRLLPTLPKIDMVYAISTPITVGLAAMRIKSRYKVPYVFEVGDLWPDAPVELGFIKNRFLKSILFRLEKQIYQNATSIVALSDQIGKAIAQKSSGKHIHIISNFSDTAYYSPEKKRQDLELKYNVENKFVVSYIGALGFANGLDFLLECARSAQKENLPVHFLICGEGAMRENLKIAAANLGLKNVSFYSLLSREGVKEVLNVTDANFVCYRPEPILETGSPNKYFDGLAAGKLILINFNGWIREEIEREQCGVYINKNRPSEFSACIAPFIDDNNRLLRYQNNARTVAQRLYSRSVLSEKFAAIFSDMVVRTDH